MKRKDGISNRGKESWRIKIELPRDPATGERRTHYETVRGTREDAKARRIALLDRMYKGDKVESSALDLATYLRSWLMAPDNLPAEARARWTPADLSPKTAERYRQLSEQQIIPHLGAISLRKLDTAHVRDWHAKLLAAGGKDGRPLHPRTVGHAHRLLHRALARAVEDGKLFRNVAGVKPPKVEDEELEILTADQIADCLAKLRDHALYSIVYVALGTGLRRGELLGLQWSDIDFDASMLRVERSIEETQAGLRFKPPKSKAGRRTISLAPSTVETLRSHRRRQLEARMALGLGKAPDDALVFCQHDGAPMSPDKLSRDWARLVASRKLPRVSFHALRHSHVSALVAAGIDVHSVSERIGHGSAALTLRVYTHLFTKKDAAAAAAIEAMLKM
jgi:integrase